MTSLLRSAGRGIAYCALLLPFSILSLVRPRAAVSWWNRLRTGVLGKPPVPAVRRPTMARALGHSVLSAALGAAALVPLGMLVLFVARGVFYGLVVAGPYDTAWGGPSRAGAWATHFAISLPLAAVAAAALVGIAAVHQRLTAALTGDRLPAGIVSLAFAVPLPAVVLFIAWLHQI